MNQISKPLEAALAVASQLPLDQQNLLALEIAERAGALAGLPSELSLREQAELEAKLAAARRGELASEADVAALFAKIGL